MRKHSLAASAILAMVLVACGSSTPPSSTASPTLSCVNAGAPHHAYVVVEHLSGQSLQRCVGFSGDTIGGQALMDQSGIKFQTQTFSLGKAACATDNEPAQFSQCLSPNQYWALFVETNGAWTMAQTGYEAVNLHDKDALGWHYVPQGGASPSPPPPANEA